MTIDELLVGIDIALGDLALSDCPAFDLNGDGVITVDELLAAVDAALNGCASRPRAIIQRSASPMPLSRKDFAIPGRTHG